MHNFFSVFFVNFIYNHYMFRTSPGPSSGGASVFIRHLVLILSGMQDGISFHPATNLMHNFLSVFFVNFIYNHYMFRTSPGPSSRGTSVFIRHLVLILSGMQDGMSFHPATNLMHNFFSVFFVNFIYNHYMFRNSPGPSSGGTSVFMRHWVLVILYSRLWYAGWNFIPSCIPDRISTKCRVNTLVPPDDGPGEVRNM